MKNSHTDFNPSIAKLTLAFFQGRISSSENDQLDQWVEALQDNLKIFEEFVEIAFRNHPLQPASNQQP
jgi:hypothetical protein